MSSVRSLQEVFEGIHNAKAGATNFRSNFFPSEPKLLAWIEHRELLSMPRKGVSFFLRKNRDVWQLFFCAANPEALRGEAARLPELLTEPVVTDLVGTESMLGELDAVFQDIGFRPYARLQRLYRGPWSPINNRDRDPRVIYAEPADAVGILRIIEESFNHYAEQLPTLYELENAIQRQQITVVKSEGNIAGLLFSETQGVASTVRFWAVDQRFRSLRVGSALMLNYLATHADAVKRFTLWVNGDNKNAIQKYEHYGYAPDGYVDHVLANARVSA
jgi:ribosomal protein S18 acetylase RimI-like enzyme